jgi:hypothetical protein
LGDKFTPGGQSLPPGVKLRMALWRSGHRVRLGNWRPGFDSRRVYIGVDVMITIFCDLWQFSAKQLAFFSKTNVMIKFLQKLAVVWAKIANILAKFFGENIFKIITSVPDWMNFDPLDDCSLWIVFFENYRSCHICGLLFPRQKLCIIFVKNGFGYIFWTLF